MTETRRIVGTPEQVAEAKAKAAADRAAAGLPPRKRDHGPFAEMMAEAGFGPERIIAAAGFFQKLRNEFVFIVGDEKFDAFLATFPT